MRKIDNLTIEEMISKLDEACGRLIVPSVGNPVISKAKELIVEVSIALGNVSNELEYFDDEEDFDEDDGEY